MESGVAFVSLHPMQARRLAPGVLVVLFLAGCAGQKSAEKPALVETPAAEEYTDYGHRDATRASIDPSSTFAVDVDTASYALTRQKLSSGVLPLPAAVRVEEFVNALPYDYRPPSTEPLSAFLEAAPSPFSAGGHLVRVGIQGRRVAFDERRPAHLTLLVDTSGSTAVGNKLDLAKTALNQLIGELGEADTVAVVAFGGTAGLVLAPTSAAQSAEIVGAIDGLVAGGNSALEYGLDLAYDQAKRSFRDGDINRVILCSDGDASVGATTHQSLVSVISERAKQGVELTVLGFGPSSYSDTTLERLADDGDGNYFYVDTENEARRVVVDRLTSTLQVIARDVKVQVVWTEAVESYRLVGYENRELADHEFTDDGADGGEVGAGHQVTALYEVALAPDASGPIATVRIRSKPPGADKPATEQSHVLAFETFKPSTAEGSPSFRIAVAAAYFAEILRHSPHTRSLRYDDVLALARGAERLEYAEDAELIALIEAAARL